MGIIIILIIFERITQNNPYIHTLTKKWPKRTNVNARIQVSATVLCNSILSFSLCIYVETKRRKHGRKFSIRHKKKQEKCLERITNLNTQVKEEYDTSFSVIFYKNNSHTKLT